MPQVFAGRAPAWINDDSSFLLRGVAFSRLIVLSDPHPPIPGQMDYIV